ncbi:MAG: hypothetical protein DHS20C18_53360 [Saprospiraceae bacterium]|nr:MAG: hypothetical protein DHS20C18_53360 [Saprospiraceae bacterium]
MGIAERRLKEKKKVKSAILKTGWKMVKETGWESLSLRKIADAIEYSVPVIYDHFANKEAILTEFSNKGYKLLSKKVQKAREKHQDPYEQLKVIADAYWDFALKNREYYQLIFGVGMPSCEGGKCAEDKTSFDFLVMESINEAILNSKQPDTNPCLKYYTYCSILHGFVSIKIMGNSPVPGELDKMVLKDAINGFIKNLD